jgi:hypothetical protein
VANCIADSDVKQGDACHAPVTNANVQQCESVDNLNKIKIEVQCKDTHITQQIGALISALQHGQQHAACAYPATPSLLPSPPPQPQMQQCTVTPTHHTLHAKPCYAQPETSKPQQRTTPHPDMKLQLETICNITREQNLTLKNFANALTMQIRS